MLMFIYRWSLAARQRVNGRGRQTRNFPTKRRARALQSRKTK